MRYKKYTNAVPVRMYRSQKEVLNALMRDENYCKRRNYCSESDVVRSALNKELREFEQHQFRKEVSS
tara:strand:+ start:78 stop:278 length:201 start_codon:yes stop_codon:yes gene_type:complete